MVVAAAQAQYSRADYLTRFDTDHDGRVSEAEYLAYMGRGFAAMDADGNGVLEGAELPGGHGRPVTRNAHQANLRRQFRRLDANHDGVLDAAELTTPPG